MPHLCFDQVNNINSHKPIPMSRDGTKTKNKMNKQIKKLILNKRTISNLNTVEMSRKAGGVRRTDRCEISELCTHRCGGGGGGQTQNGNTCAGHNTCNAC